MMLDKLTKDIFADYIGTSFQLKLVSSEVITLELTEVTTLHSRRPEQRQPFSIVFRGPHTPALGQAMYVLSHKQMGVIENLFLAPIGLDERGRYYEAVFN
ncbi:MAG TPA: hypothetical protein VEC93_02130 [Anaerolineae bacterium]|nr:hypothetical protein [Anaerolineae bacterium]